MYSASQEGHGKSADNECCNTLILLIAILRNIVRISRDRQDWAGFACDKTLSFTENMSPHTRS